MGDLVGMGMDVQGSQLRKTYGDIPLSLAKSMTKQIGPTQRFLGFGPQAGSRADIRGNRMLANATGPMAEAVRDIRGFAPDVINEAQGVGARIAGMAPGAFNALQGQIDSYLSTLPQFQEASQQGLEYAKQYGKEAFDPVSMTPFFKEAARRGMADVRAGEAARGMTESGVGGGLEADYMRQLTGDFANQQLAMQQGVPGMLQGAAGSAAEMQQAGIPAAQLGMQSLGALGDLLSQAFNMPMQAAGGLMSLLQGGITPAMQLLQQTQPQYTGYSHPTGFAGIPIDK